MNGVEFSSGSSIPEEHKDEDEIIGYVEPWIVTPGQTIEVKVSSTVPKYTWSLVRNVQGFQDEHAPPFHQEPVLTPPETKKIFTGVYRLAHPGSYAVIESWKTLKQSPYPFSGLAYCFFVQPWLLEAGHNQVLLSNLDVSGNVGFAVVLNKHGKLCIYCGDGQSVQVHETSIRLSRRRWALLTGKIELNRIYLAVDHCSNFAEKVPEPSIFETASETNLNSVFLSSKPLTLAAGYFTDADLASEVPVCCFNGRLESLSIDVLRQGGEYQPWAKYDFSLDMSSDRIVDISGAARDGVLVNAPTRAVKGHDWDGSESNWTKTNKGYGAIHFHEDDLDDAAWPTDFEITVPETALSGSYAVQITSSNNAVTGTIMFFVRPSHADQGRKPRVAMVLPTFTYLAYANERMYDETLPSYLPLGQIRKDHIWRSMARRTDLGLSLYDMHRDGSGTVFSSCKRPILNIRPDYVNWEFHRPREFSADQFMIAFLEEKLGCGNYDVLTDHDLHINGVDLIAGYDVVVSGSHPEYPSSQVLNAYMNFAQRGGSIMYLGGNGFYWCSATDPGRAHRMEVRRGDQGCRSFSLEPGEQIHSLTGEQGALWRSRGRPPQQLFGVGSCACGSGKGVPYEANDAVVQLPQFQWLWEGLRQAPSDPLPLIGVEGF